MTIPATEQRVVATRRTAWSSWRLLPATRCSQRLLPVLFGLLLTACGTAAGQHEQRSADTLYGEWTLTQIRQGSLGLTLGSDRPSFTLSLREDGSARGDVACNTWTGQARLGNGLLRLQRTRATRSQCQFDDPRVAALARRYLNALESIAHFQLDGQELTLALSNGEVWQFRR